MHRLKKDWRDIAYLVLYPLIIPGWGLLVSLLWLVFMSMIEVIFMKMNREEWWLDRNIRYYQYIEHLQEMFDIDEYNGFLTEV